MKNDSIFVITTLQPSLYKIHRTVSFTHELEEAKKIVENNICDIAEEGYYLFCIIEETVPGIYNIPENEWWYQWNPSTGCYEPTEKPDKFKIAVGFGIA